jgi:hypothetical protein
MMERSLQSPISGGSLRLVGAAKRMENAGPASGRCDQVPLRAVGTAA